MDEILDNQFQNTEQSAEYVEQVTPPQVDVPIETFEIKHNKDVLKVTKDELLKLASKGADYDRIRPAYEHVKSLAGGEDVSQYIETARNTLSHDDTAKLAAEREALIQTYLENGIPEIVALDLAESKLEKRSNALLADKKAKEDSEQKKQRDQLDRILKENPNYTKNGEVLIPQDVIDDCIERINSGEANNIYSAHKLVKADLEKVDLLKRLEVFEKTQSAVKANAENSVASVGSVTSTPAAEQALTEEMIANMSPKELMKRWAEVKKVTRMK